MAVGADLLAQVDDAGADLVACDGETCRWQIEHGDRAPCHTPKLLHRALRL
jgi:Fe-S oxidoreductase